VKKISLESLYRTLGWPLYKKYGHAYDAFKLALSQDATEDIFEGLAISDELRSDVLVNIKRKLTPQPAKIRADIEVCGCVGVCMSTYVCVCLCMCIYVCMSIYVHVYIYIIGIVHNHNLYSAHT
jgi:hypothetical protein